MSTSRRRRDGGEGKEENVGNAVTEGHNSRKSDVCSLLYRDLMLAGCYISQMSVPSKHPVTMETRRDKVESGHLCPNKVSHQISLLKICAASLALEV